MDTEPSCATQENMSTQASAYTLTGISSTVGPFSLCTWRLFLTFHTSSFNLSTNRKMYIHRMSVLHFFLLFGSETSCQTIFQQISVSPGTNENASNWPLHIRTTEMSETGYKTHWIFNAVSRSKLQWTLFIYFHVLIYCRSHTGFDLIVLGYFWPCIFNFGGIFALSAKNVCPWSALISYMASLQSNWQKSVVATKKFNAWERNHCGLILSLHTNLRHLMVV